MKSDAARYLWFDWQARWSSIEVQPSSIAKYSLAGLPYFSKTFEYSTQQGEELNDSENYLTKLSRARRNYTPNWAYAPYFIIEQLIDLIIGTIIFFLIPLITLR
jgi:hypothetical protein